MQRQKRCLSLVYPANLAGVPDALHAVQAPKPAEFYPLHAVQVPKPAEFYPSHAVQVPKPAEFCALHAVQRQK